MPRTRTEPVSSSPWKSPHPPRRILIIRLHAIGDVAITLPAVAAFMKQFPDARVDFLTTRTCASFFDAMSISGTVFSLPDRLDRWGRLARGLGAGYMMQKNKYDVVIDVQRNWVSRLVRRMAFPRSWGEFERYTRHTAGERVLKAFQCAGFLNLPFTHHVPVKDSSLAHARHMLLDAGWSGTSRLIVLNPAGLWATRQWPAGNYVEIARLLLEENETHFLLLGTDRIRERARSLKDSLGSRLVDLVELTTLGEALAILRLCSGMVTEDSGLMHMAWASGVPLVALFGSTNHVVSAPAGPHVRLFDSGDLDCGACMLTRCIHNDVRCMTRISPQRVYHALTDLMRNPPQQASHTPAVDRSI